MYRAAALDALENNITTDPEAVARHCAQIKLDFDWSFNPAHVLLNGRDVAQAIRRQVVTQNTFVAADNPKVRELLVRRQREIGGECGSLVSEGRDQGTVVFPDADCKFFLIADVNERARRRMQQLLQMNLSADENQIATEIATRDHKDRNRPVGPLLQAPDAHVIDATHLSLEEVVQAMLNHIEAEKNMSEQAKPTQPGESEIVQEKAGDKSAAPPVKFTYRGEGTDFIQVLEWDIGKIFFQFIAMLFFQVRIFGRNNIPAKGGALLVTNHQSFLDPWMIGIALHRQIHFMARESIFKGGFWQYALERTNAFPIRRGRADSTAIREAISRLNKGYLVNIFPEATRTNDGTIGPIASGVAVIVHRAGVPVIPVVIDGAFEVLPRTRKLPRFGKVRVRYGVPIPFKELKDLSADLISIRIRREMIHLQKHLGSPHTAASQRRFEDDLAAGKARLVVSRELSA